MLQRSLLTIVALVVGASSLACHKRPALPSPDVLSAEVTIRRDTFGIPRILAGSEEAAAFGFGYAQAEDHAVEIVRRMIARTAAKWPGISERAAYRTIFNMAQFDNCRGRPWPDRSSPRSSADLTAYAAGVNEYLERAPRASCPIGDGDLGRPTCWRAAARARPTTLAGAALQQRLAPSIQGQRTGPDRTRCSTRRRRLQRVRARRFANRDRQADPARQSPSELVVALLGSARACAGSHRLLWIRRCRHPGPARRIQRSARLRYHEQRTGSRRCLRAGARSVERAGSLHVRQADPMPLMRRDVDGPGSVHDGSLPLRDARTFWSTTSGRWCSARTGRAFTVKSTRLRRIPATSRASTCSSKARTLDDGFSTIGSKLVPTSNFTYADADGNILYLWNARCRSVSRERRLPPRRARRRPRRLWSRIHAVDDLPRLLNPRGGISRTPNNPPGSFRCADPIDMSSFRRYFERRPLGCGRSSRSTARRPGTASASDDRDPAKVRHADAARPRCPVDCSRRCGHLADYRRGAGGWGSACGLGRSVAADSRGAVLFQRFWDAYARRCGQPFATPWPTRIPCDTPPGSRIPSPPSSIWPGLSADAPSQRIQAVAWGAANRFRIGSLDLPGEGATGTYGTLPGAIRFDPVPGSGPALRAAGNLGREGRAIDRIRRRMGSAGRLLASP